MEREILDNKSLEGIQTSRRNTILRSEYEERFISMLRNHCLRSNSGGFMH